jgi:dUTP pyrophosphatase
MIPTFSFALREGLDETFLPTKGSVYATGYDVRAAWENKDDYIIQPGEYIKIPLGFRVIAPIGWWLELRPRSSTFAKKHLHALYGVIDEDYEGENVFACHLPRSEEPLLIKFGEAIGQIIPVETKVMLVESISNELYDQTVAHRGYHRGAGGFGSTDKK